MGKLSDDLIEAVMARVFGAATLTVATHHRIVMSSTEPQTDGTGITHPPSLNGYAPVVVNNNGTTWNTPAGRASSNAIPIAFPTVTAADNDSGWGDNRWFAILDNDTGAYLGSGRFSTVVSPRVTNTPTFAAGELVITGPSG